MIRIVLSLVAIVVAAVLVFGAYQMNTSGKQTAVPAKKPGTVVTAPVKPVGDPAEREAIENLKLR